MIARRRCESDIGGVTLVELMVGVSMMTGIIASAYFCLHAGFTSQTALDEHMEQVQKARVMLSLMTKDLRHACVWSEDSPFVGMDRTLGTMEADNLDFTTHNWSPRARGEGDICEISYYVNKDPRTGAIGIWRRRDSSPDPEPLSGGEREELVPGVRALRFEYYDGFLWYDSWGRVDPRRELQSQPTESRDESSMSLLAGNLYGLPDAVRISIAFGDEQEEEARRAIPTATSGAGRDADSSSTPRIFQTVVYLNLANRARSYSVDTNDAGENNTQGGNTQ